jgi:mono/diheme cytochrome c family protein
MARKILFVSVLIVLLTALAVSVALAQTSGDPKKGETLWTANNCKNCHGDKGEGKYAGVRAGDGKAAADWIKQARTPRANMPAYDAAHISDADITDMWAYMQTLKKPDAFTPTVFKTEASDPAGKLLMAEKRCVACHANPAAFVKSRFVDQKREVTTEAVLKQLRTPASKMPMFSAAQVSDAQAAQIADFLKTQATAAAAAAPAALPKTGGPLVLLALGGLALLGAGLAFRRGTR